MHYLVFHLLLMTKILNKYVFWSIYQRFCSFFVCFNYMISYYKNLNFSLIRWVCSGGQIRFSQNQKRSILKEHQFMSIFQKILKQLLSIYEYSPVFSKKVNVFAMFSKGNNISVNFFRNYQDICVFFKIINCFATTQFSRIQLFRKNCTFLILFRH